MQCAILRGRSSVWRATTGLVLVPQGGPEVLQGGRPAPRTTKSQNGGRGRAQDTRGGVPEASAGGRLALWQGLEHVWRGSQHLEASVQVMGEGSAAPHHHPEGEKTRCQRLGDPQTSWAVRLGVRGAGKRGGDSAEAAGQWATCASRRASSSHPFSLSTEWTALYLRLLGGAPGA